MNSDNNLAYRTSEKIHNYIVENKLQVGDKLPNEFNLAKALEIGRSTLREAMKILSSEQIVEVKHGSGTYVKNLVRVSDDPLGFSQVEDRHQLTVDLYDLRTLIEPKSAGLAAANATDEEIDILRRLMVACEEELMKGSDLAYDLDIQFHNAIAEMSKHLAMPHLYPVLSHSNRLFKRTHLSQKTRESIVDMHREIFQAIQNRQPQQAAEAMLIHLTNHKRYLNKDK